MFGQEETVKIGQVFTPAAPVQEWELFAGRTMQVQRVFDAINQTGMHAVLYGERGVGKTSLANVLPKIASVLDLKSPFVKQNCTADSTFQKLWLSACSELSWREDVSVPGFVQTPRSELRSLAQLLTPEFQVSDLVGLLKKAGRAVVTFDEFDRLNAGEAAKFADLIKALSDQGASVTIVLVGVADDIEELIREHASVERSISQIHMPRMSPDELKEVLKRGAERLDIKFLDAARTMIVQMSQGLPHYTHLLAKGSARVAVNDGRRRVAREDVIKGIEEGLADAQQTIKSAVHKATSSSRSDAIFEHVLIACALARKDELSFFRAGDVAEPLSRIMGRRYEIPAYSRHLKEFASLGRGQIILRTGARRNYRYRFQNPLVEPYIIMRGIQNGIIYPSGAGLSAGTDE